MTVARGRGRGRTPGSHYFGAGGQWYAGGQGGRNSLASAPDGRTHLIPRSIRNTPPQQTVSEQHVPGVNISSTQQTSLSRHMGETNPTTSYVARSCCQLPTNTTSYSQQSWLNIGNIPSHTGIREDGTFDGLDGNTNSRALVPYNVQPDPIASQQAIVVATPSGPTEENNANALVVRRTSYGLRNSASNYARRTAESPTPKSLSEKTVPCIGPVLIRKTKIWQ